MVWRIQDSVIRGEIDNRMKGRVRGKLWLDGLDKPVKLEIEGNACPISRVACSNSGISPKHFKPGELKKLCSLEFHFKEVKNRFKKMGLPGTFRGGLPARVRARSGD